MESAYRTLSKNPRQSASWISILTFGWTIPMFKRSYNKVLNANDVFAPVDEDHSDRLGDRLEKNWEMEKKKEKPSLTRALVKTFWRQLIILGFMSLFSNCVCQLSYAFILKGLLSCFRGNSVESNDDALNYGIGFVILTVFCGASYMHLFFYDNVSGMKVRVAISSLLYRKTLRLAQKALTNTSPGKLANLLSNDLQRFNRLLIHPLWVAPVATIIATYILWTEIRWAAIFGIIVIFLLVPIQSYSGKLLAKFRLETALRTDERVRFMDEIVSGVQVIKMFGWQRPFEGLIAAARRSELKLVIKSLCVNSLNLTVFFFVNRLALFCTVLSFISLYGSENMTIAKMFVTSHLFHVISLTMCRFFFQSLSECSEAFVTIKRLQRFLENEEKCEVKSGPDHISSDELESQDLSILMKNVTVEWSAAGIQTNSSKKDKDNVEKNASESVPFRLQGLNLEMAKGKLVFIVGSVGSGKSTLMQVLLRELPLIKGSMGINGTISYASQVNWTFTSTIRQNITFGQSIDRSRYDEVIKCAALAKDFKQFGSGDMTMVGENGAGLSGGQKARINLARAMYRKADIYLIDDPLSAVDTHVQSHLFNECIGPNGYLARKNSTRILITHQLHFMSEADWIVVMKDGKIEIQGDYDSVLKSGVDFTSMLTHHKNDEEEADDRNEIENIRKNSTLSKGNSNEEVNNVEEDSKNFDEQTALTKDLEESSKGKIKGSLLLNYLKSSNIPCAIAILLTLFLMSQIILSVADIWVSHWIGIEEDRAYEIKSTSARNLTSVDVVSDLWPTETYVLIYTGIMLLLIDISSLRGIIFSIVCTKASQNLHDNMFHGLISTKLKFFYENAVGRIMNNFTKDLGAIDDVLPKTLLEEVQMILIISGSITITIFTDFRISIAVILMGVVLVMVCNAYLKCSKNIMQLEGKTKSPVFTHISATLNGLSVVRAFQAEEILRDEFDRHQNLNTGTYFMFWGTANAFGLSVDVMIYLLFGVVVYVVLVLKEGVTGDQVGLALNQASFLIGTLQFALKLGANVTNQLTSVERILEYSQLEPETQPEVPQKVSSDWPSKGKIEFKQVSYRYSADDEPVLRGLSFSVNPKEKVSVVGRTGAGKSSLISSIFRLAIVDGDILLDDVNTSSVDLNVLRSRISIIPQDPTLFSGTLRRNLDPFEEYSDADIWSALDNVELKEFVSKNNGLEMAVLAHGQNFSTGQRQI
ncbi:multidrug resistance-associated protein 4-like, partial [Contarinia nasturtii]|uniref:multidrug resistance-associated protein 4-like n=1 Tax=Contarinia nasturtii TaxID=265458 RepID=UPI0012D37E9D